jgi:hypothetical protein
MRHNLVYIPQLPPFFLNIGLQKEDGSTAQEALANVEALIQEWIERAEEPGCALP